jgi:DNA replication initiation complex subunit (GINS family)
MTPEERKKFFKVPQMMTREKEFFKKDLAYFAL